MKLGNPAKQYDSGDQARMRGAIEQADAKNHKNDRDIEVGSGKRVILTDTTNGHRYALTVAAGVLTLTAL